MRSISGDAEGIVFNIQEFSIQDGPGVRTTVFFQGCNLRCRWCHNPESWYAKPRLVFRPERCVGCGVCISACRKGAIRSAEGVLTVSRELCDNCGACADVCYAGTYSLSGERKTAGKIMERIIACKPYFENGKGGVTFSGGECMMQIDFLEACLRICKENGIHTAVDTAGHVPYENFLRLLPFTDLFLYDIKAAGPDLHKTLTGADGVLIWENLKRLLNDGAKVHVRVPCIPGANWKEMPAIAKRLADYPIPAVELCPYHRLGEGKFNFLGMEALRYEPPADREMEELLPLFQKEGRAVTITGLKLF